MTQEFNNKNIPGNGSSKKRNLEAQLCRYKSGVSLLKNSTKFKLYYITAFTL